MPSRTAAVLLVLVLAAGAAQGQVRERSFTQEYSFAPTGTVTVLNYKGSIEVVPWDLDEVQVHVVIEAEDVDGEVMLPHVAVRITGSLDTLTVETDYRGALARLRELFPDAVSPRLPLVHLVVRLPAAARLRIDDYMSAIRLDGLTADVEVYSYKGEVDIRGFSGTLRLNTHMGRARVAFSHLRHDAAIGAYEGEVTVALPSGAGFDLALDLGAPGARFAPDSTFHAVGGTAGRAAATAAQGPRTFQEAVNGGGPRLALSSHSGLVRLSQAPPPREAAR